MCNSNGKWYKCVIVMVSDIQVCNSNGKWYKCVIVMVSDTSV